MRNRRNVGDIRDLVTHRVQRADRRLTAGARPLDANLKVLQAVVERSLTGTLCRNLCRERRGLARTAKAGTTRGCPGQRIALTVGDRDDRVVEGRVNVGDTIDHRLLHALAWLRTRLCHYLLPKRFSS